MDAYLDNVIVSGLVNRDLEPPAEQPAAEALLDMHERGEIVLGTSHVTKEELRAIPDVHRADKEAMYNRVLELPEVPEARPNSGLLLMGIGGGTREDSRFSELKGLLRVDDARHVFQAIANEVPVFVTTDRRTILSRASEIESRFQIKLVPPSELRAALESAND